MARKNGLTQDQHEALEARLREVQTTLRDAMNEIGAAYALSGREYRLANKAHRSVEELRVRLATVCDLEAERQAGN